MHGLVVTCKRDGQLAKAKQKFSKNFIAVRERNERCSLKIEGTDHFQEVEVLVKAINSY